MMTAYRECQSTLAVRMTGRHRQRYWFIIPDGTAHMGDDWHAGVHTRFPSNTEHFSLTRLRIRLSPHRRMVQNEHAPCPLPVEPVFQIGSLLRTFEQQPLPEIIVCSFRINQIPRRNR